MGEEAAGIRADKVVIELDLGGISVGEDGETFRDHVAEIAARRLLHGDVGREELRRRVAAIRDEEIREHVRPLVVEALEKALVPTDSFGNPVGAATTLHDVIVGLVRDEVTRKRDGGFSSRRGGTTMVEDFIRDEVEKALGAELREAVREAKADVLAAVRGQAADVITETIERVSRGRSL